MKLASYIADGRRVFGAVIGEEVVMLNERLGGRYGSLREALAADALAEMKTTAQTGKPDHGLHEYWLSAGIGAPTPPRFQT